jgi:uncharacterized Zn-finger protein
MTPTESWEAEGGAPPRYVRDGGAAGSCAFPIVRALSGRKALERRAVTTVISLGGLGTIMHEGRYRQLQNDRAVPEIRIGMREFNCIGASPPHDHPHVYINMGDHDTILCPYCATRYTYDARLAPFGVDPEDSLFVDSNRVV